MNVRWDELYELPCPAAFLCNSTVIRTVLAIHVSCVNPATTPTCVTHLHVESNAFQNSCTNFFCNIKVHNLCQQCVKSERKVQGDD